MLKIVRWRRDVASHALRREIEVAGEFSLGLRGNPLLWVTDTTQIQTLTDNDLVVASA